MKKILKMTLKENKVKKKTESFTKTNENPTEKNVVENKKQKSGIKKSRSIVEMCIRDRQSTSYGMG